MKRLQTMRCLTNYIKKNIETFSLLRLAILFDMINLGGYHECSPNDKTTPHEYLRPNIATFHGSDDSTGDWVTGQSGKTDDREVHSDVGASSR